MNKIGFIEDAHGWKGAVKVKPLNGSGEKLLDLKKVSLVDRSGKQLSQEVYEVKKYRDGKFLMKFKGLKWRVEVEGLKKFSLVF